MRLALGLYFLLSLSLVKEASISGHSEKSQAPAMLIELCTASLRPYPRFRAYIITLTKLTRGLSEEMCAGSNKTTHTDRKAMVFSDVPAPRLVLRSWLTYW